MSTSQTITPPPSFLQLAAQVIQDSAAIVTLGRVVRVTGMLMEAHVPNARVGEIIEVERDGGRVPGQVVGLRESLALIVPFEDVRGVVAGARVHRSTLGAEMPVGDALLGRVVDVFGHAIDGGDPIECDAAVPIDQGAPALGARARISERFDTGVRIIDALLTCGRGQRFGIFAGAGVGKTMLMREILAHSNADVVVVGLIGERGCEVHDLLVGEQMARSVVVAATSDRSPLERARGAMAATAVAEHFRDRGKHVLLVIDSLTRYAMALREIGLAAGEPPATKGYPPSVFAAMPRLLERAAPLAKGGSITGVYTVLVEGDDLADPVADSARSLLDGHIVLSRAMASRGQFPAVDVLASTSRVAHRVTSHAAQVLMEKGRGMLATRREVDELKSLGAYVPGTNATNDEALALGARFDTWAKQKSGHPSKYEESMRGLSDILAAMKAA